MIVRETLPRANFLAIQSKAKYPTTLSKRGTNRIGTAIANPKKNAITALINGFSQASNKSLFLLATSEIEINTSKAGSVDIFVPKARPIKIQYKENPAFSLTKK
jgi:hypothetical protein